MAKNKSALFEKRARYGYIFIIPLIIGVLLIFIPNLIQTFMYSVSTIDTESGFKLNFSGFSAYYSALKHDPNFVPMLVSNIKTWLINVPVILIYSLLIATLLNQNFKGRVIARVIFFIPVILVAGALAQTDSTALYYSGAGQAIEGDGTSAASAFTDMSALLSSLSFPKFLTDIVTDAVSNIYDIVCSSGLQIFIFLAGLQEIPASVYEAASIEGCSKWELFWKITLPMIAPQIAVNAVYTISVTADDANGMFWYTNVLAFSENQYALANAMNILYLLALSVFVVIILAVMKKFLANAEG